MLVITRAGYFRIYVINIEIVIVKNVVELGPKYRLRMNEQKMKVCCRSAAKTRLRQRESNLGTEIV